jgi:cell division protein FtsA
MNALATDDDLRQGCAVIDFGAQTTTLTVFKGTQYLHNKVVAMGGYDITRDIELLGIPFARAERVKCEYGWASPNLVPVGEGDDPDGKVLRTKREVAKIIESRLNTTLEPLFEILEKEAERLKVVYLTGAGSMLQGLEQYIQAHTSVPVMYGSHAEWLTSDTPDEMCMPSYSSLIGTLLLGASYRKTHPEKKPTRSSKIFEFLTVETLDLFSGHTHDDYKKDETQLKK